MKSVLPLLVVLSLASCASPQVCKPVVINAPAPPPQIVTKTVVVHVQSTHASIIDAYQATLPAQTALVKTGTPAAIWTLTTLNAAVAVALRPLLRRGHRPTDKELSDAIAALGALQTFLRSPHAHAAAPPLHLR